MSATQFEQYSDVELANLVEAGQAELIQNHTSAAHWPPSAVASIYERQN